VLYGAWALLLIAAIDSSGFEATQRNRAVAIGRALLVVAIILVHGYIDEITQPLTNRTYDLWDLAADLCGAIVAIGLWYTWVPLWQQRNAKPPE
jgi:VanZ family protein